jgi:hypothetical protein
MLITPKRGVGVRILVCLGSNPNRGERVHAPWVFNQDDKTECFSGPRRLDRAFPRAKTTGQSVSQGESVSVRTM